MGQESQYPLPEPSMPLHYTNSTGLRYEAEEGLKRALRCHWRSHPS
uniref:Uncharacterized protein n=1 Tax=Anguilla anguilla TaxID=7936 RepID=A0A0E9USE8_ANGAN